MEVTMTNAELEKYNAGRKFWQVCTATNDIDKTVKAWVDVLGVGPWRISTFSNESMKGFTVGGKSVEEPFKFLIGISHIGDIEIEIIQPVYGPSIYPEFLKRKGPGLHHIKEKLLGDSLDKEIKRYNSIGCDVLQTGWFADQDVHYYINTEPKTDFIMELGNCPEIIVPEGFSRMYPEQ
jgi:hypothetical protein